MLTYGEEIYSRMDEFETNPTIHEIKSHATAKEAAFFCKTSKDVDKWIVSNEVADAAAGAGADHQGSHEAELNAEEYAKAHLLQGQGRSQRLRIL